jgi:Txe/YoeB family toxin of toxin-antitoxin system
LTSKNRQKKDLNKLRKNKKLLAKALLILDIICVDPYADTYKFERLKHNYAGFVVKRLDKKNRIIYQVEFIDPIITNKKIPSKEHGRIEKRQIRTLKPNTKYPGRLGFIKDPFWRKHVKTIVEITRIIKTKDTKKSTKDKAIYKISTEKSYHFTTIATIRTAKLH